MRRRSGGREAIVAELPGAVADAIFAKSSRTNCATEMSAMRCRRSFSRHRRISVRTAAGMVAGSASQSGSRSRIAAMRVGDGVARERRAAREHFVEHAPERPDVRPPVQRLAASPAPGSCRPAVPRIRSASPRLVGGHDRRRAVRGHACAGAVPYLRQAEVEHLHGAIGA